VRNHADITEQLFEEMVSRGAAAEMNLQKMLYQLIDNESTLEDLLRLRPMPKPRWVPVMFNLVTCSLVSFSDRPLREGVEEAAAENIDWPAIQAFEDSIKIAETGFLSYPAFFYHLEREYERFERFQRPFSLIILEISIKEELSETKDPKVLQDRAVLGQVSTRVDKLKRKTDIAGHFGDAQFALLLLETEGDAARNFASRLAEAIAMNPFTTDRVEVVRLTVSLGVASVPETCRDLGRLISAARPQNSQKD
jgi:diguanylate cyclase (GGDEF)-like protein